MKIIVGLGNPKEKYQNTRHNLGFMVVEEVGNRVERIAFSWKYEERFRAEILKINYTLNANISTLLVKPQTFMNNSGVAVAGIVNFYKVSLEDLIIIHDDLDLPLGKIKIRQSGSAAGHHGVESVIKSLGSDKFIRVRLGIGNEKSMGSGHFDAEEYVVEPFLSSEKGKLKHLLKQALLAVEILLNSGLEIAQNQYN